MKHQMECTTINEEDMTQDDKDLLLKDLCARLPYGVKVKVIDVDGFTFEGELCVISKGWCKLNISDPKKKARVKNEVIPLNYIYIKPYLRPMSSMTEEEYNELKELSSYYGLAPFEDIHNWTPNYELIGWLNAHHFDYRGLIPKGLAIEAQPEIYK